MSNEDEMISRLVDHAQHKIDTMTAQIPDHVSRTDIATIAVVTSMTGIAAVLEALEDSSDRPRLARVYREVADRLLS